MEIMEYEKALREKVEDLIGEKEYEKYKEYEERKREESDYSYLDLAESCTFHREEISDADDVYVGFEPYEREIIEGEYGEPDVYGTTVIRSTTIDDTPKKIYVTLYYITQVFSDEDIVR